MTAAQSLRLYELTLDFIKDKNLAKEYVTKIEEVVDEKVDRRTETFEKIVNKDVENLRQEMYKVFATKEDLQRTKTDLIQWLVAMWVAQMAAILFIILRK